ncbi:MAG: MFS transporter [Thermodesulfobacteriota bacterium]
MNNEARLTWLTGFSHFITHGYMSLLPAVLVAITSEQAASFLSIGIIANIGYFLYGLGSFPAGWLADRYGAKRVLSIGVLGMAVSSVLVGVMPGTLGFAVAYALLGLFASIHHPAGLALIARRVRERKGRALGIHGVLGNVGLFLSPLVAAAAILTTGSWRTAYIFYGMVGFVYFLVLHRGRIDEEADLRLAELFQWRPQRRGAEAAARESTEAILPAAMLVLYCGSILSGFIFRGSLTFFPTLLQREVLAISGHDEPVVVAGFATSAILSLGLIGAWFGGWINDKIKVPEYFPVAVFLLVTPTLWCLSRFTDSSLLAAAAFFALVYYTWQPSHNYLIAKYTRISSHGKGFGVNFFLLFGIGSIATAVGGYYADTYGVDHFYRIMAYVAAAALLAAVSVFFAKRYRFRISCQLEKSD